MEQKAVTKPVSESRRDEKSASYQVKNMTFIIEPVFRDDGSPLGNILLKMMKDDALSENPANRRCDKDG